MLIDSLELPDDGIVEADVCIVGAGAAGISLARALGAASLNVCLLESGGLEYQDAIQDRYKGENLGLPYYDLDAARLRYFGGTTNHWAGYCWRFRPGDFETRAWRPDSGWPIDYADVYKHDERIQDILDIDPPGFSLPFWLHQFERPEFFIHNKEINTDVVRFSPPTRFGPKFLEELKRSERISVYLNASVEEIEAEETGAAVTRLIGRRPDGRRFSARARSYVLAAGGIENARLLLVSDRVSKGGLGNHFDLVGRCFMEHPNFREAAEIVLSRENSSMELFFPRFDEHGRYLTRTILTLSDETVRREGLLGLSFYLDPIHVSRGMSSLKALGSEPENLASHIGNVVRDLDVIADNTYKTVFNAKKGPLGAEGDLVALSVRAAMEQAPNRSSRVTLSEKRDAYGMRRVDLDWRLGPLEKLTLRRGLEILAKEVGRAGLGRLKLNVDVSDDPTAWLNNMDGSNHHMGTTRMSDSPAAGVVDGNCRVHGIGNLYIAGSSVFATSGINPPTYTIVALALRLAEHLQRQLT